MDENVTEYNIDFSPGHPLKRNEARIYDFHLDFLHISADSNWHNVTFGIHTIYKTYFLFLTSVLKIVTVSTFSLQIVLQWLRVSSAKKKDECWILREEKKLWWVSEGGPACGQNGINGGKVIPCAPHTRDTLCLTHKRYKWFKSDTHIRSVVCTPKCQSELLRCSGESDFATQCWKGSRWLLLTLRQRKGKGSSCCYLVIIINY